VNGGAAAGVPTLHVTWEEFAFILTGAAADPVVRAWSLPYGDALERAIVIFALAHLSNLQATTIERHVAHVGLVPLCPHLHLHGTDRVTFDEVLDDEPARPLVARAVLP